jgi:uncharacterized NAD(P)/FAD-binding protein YdhS
MQCGVEPPLPPPPGGSTVCVVGAGPRGASILERLCANAGTGAPGPLRIVLVDPFPPGPGRIWRQAQSELMWLNTTAADNTIFPDDSVQCEGPVDTGPSFLDWARHEAGGVLAGTPLAVEAARVHPGYFPSRHLYSRYLSWTLERVIATAPDHVTVEWRAARALDVVDGEDGRQTVHLDDGAVVEADAVILAQGHQDVAPGPEEADLVDFARRHDLAYLPRAYTADADLSRFAPGTPVLVRGMGLAFVDCMALLFEGRGGRYEREEDGTLVYRPSGAEPRLLLGSRRGVPYHSKTTYPLAGGRPPLPRFFTPAVLTDLHARVGPLDLTRDLWPLLVKDLAFGHYHELWHAHPERTVGSWEDIVEVIGAVGTDADAAAVVAAVPDPADRLDLAWLEAPLAGVPLEGAAALQEWMQRYMLADLARRTDPSHSNDLGLITGLLTSFGVLALAAGAGLLSARTLALGLDARFFGFFSYVASGPPPVRLEQLVALSRAGLVEFLGPDMKVTADPVSGRVRAERSYGDPVEVSALLDARLPAPSVERSQDPLLSSLRSRGETLEEVHHDTGDGFTYRSGRLRTDPTHRLVRADGSAHPARFAMGPWTSGGRASSGIARPNLNALFFRQNDALAREALSLAAQSRDTGPVEVGVSAPARS